MYVLPDGSSVAVFDCHTHVGEAELFRAFALPARFGPARLAELMARDGVDAACGFSPRVYGSDYDAANRLILEEARTLGERFYPFVRFNPNNPWPLDEAPERYRRAGAVGIKLHPVTDGPYVINRHPNVLALLEHAPAKGLGVVLVHTGGHPGATPALLADLAMQFPEVRFIAGHSGYHGLHYEAMAFARRCDNLWLDTSGLEIPHCVREMVTEVGRERVLYGSDAPFGSFRLEVDKVARAAGLDAAEARAVLGANLARLLGVEPP